MNAVLRASSFSQALELAEINPHALIEVFLASWSDVDLYRALAAELSLAGRISIHHQAALDALIEMQVLKGPPADQPTRPCVTHRLEGFARAALQSLLSRLITPVTH